MTTALSIQYPRHHPRENPTLYQLAAVLADHLHVKVQWTDMFPGPVFRIPAPIEKVREAAALYLDGAGIVWGAVAEP